MLLFYNNQMFMYYSSVEHTLNSNSYYRVKYCLSGHTNEDKR